MAKIEVIKDATEDNPQSVECIEVRIWGTGGSSSQEFSIGSGGNFNASANFWVEIGYRVQGIPVFYTRNAFSDDWGIMIAMGLDGLERFVNETNDMQGFGFGSMLPETSIHIIRIKSSYKPPEGEEQHFVSYQLKISVDMGVIFGHSGPGQRMIDIRLEDIHLETGVSFMRELIQEVEAAKKGCHSDPGLLPPGASDWPFVRELNRRAYDQIATNYQENYFANPLLAGMIDDWLAGLIPGGHILDAGCGHGDPIIARLLERGFHVTGSDLSPRMLERARSQFPTVEFWERAITEIEAESLFDGACSFSSMLYLDQVDFFHSIYRLYRALKPGGSLFLYGYDLHPSWRGQPYDVEIKQWMWGGTRSMNEAARALEEHGYFKVLGVKNVMTEPEREKRIASWQKYQQEEHEKLVQQYPTVNIPAPDLSTPPSHLAYPYVLIAQKQAK